MASSMATFQQLGLMPLEDDMEISSDHGRAHESDIDIDIDLPTPRPQHGEDYDDVLVDAADDSAEELNDDVMLDENENMDDDRDMQEDGLNADEQLPGVYGEAITTSQVYAGVQPYQVHVQDDAPHFDAPGLPRQASADTEINELRGQADSNGDGSAHVELQVSADRDDRDDLDPTQADVESKDPEHLQSLDASNVDVLTASPEGKDQGSLSRDHEIANLAAEPQRSYEHGPHSNGQLRDQETLRAPHAEDSNGISGADGFVQYNEHSSAYRQSFADRSITVDYQGSKISLFPPKGQNASKTYFLENEGLVNGSIRDLLGACRNVLGESISDEEELEVHIAALDLCIGEDCVHAVDTSFSEIVDVFAQLCEQDHNAPLSLEVELYTKTRFATRLRSLIEAAAEGKTLSQIVPAEITAKERLRGRFGAEEPEANEIKPTEPGTTTAEADATQNHDYHNRVPGKNLEQRVDQAYTLLHQAAEGSHTEHDAIDGTLTQQSSLEGSAASPNQTDVNSKQDVEKQDDSEVTENAHIRAPPMADAENRNHQAKQIALEHSEHAEQALDDENRVTEHKDMSIQPNLERVDKTEHGLTEVAATKGEDDGLGNPVYADQEDELQHTDDDDGIDYGDLEATTATEGDDVGLDVGSGREDGDVQSENAEVSEGASLEEYDQQTGSEETSSVNTAKGSGYAVQLRHNDERLETASGGVESQEASIQSGGRQDDTQGENFEAQVEHPNTQAEYSETQADYPDTHPEFDDYQLDDGENSGTLVGDEIEQDRELQEDVSGDLRPQNDGLLVSNGEDNEDYKQVQQDDVDEDYELLDDSEDTESVPDPKTTQPEPAPPLRKHESASSTPYKRSRGDLEDNGTDSSAIDAADAKRVRSM